MCWTQTRNKVLLFGLINCQNLLVYLSLTEGLFQAVSGTQLATKKRKKLH